MKTTLKLDSANGEGKQNSEGGQVIQVGVTYKKRYVRPTLVCLDTTQTLGKATHDSDAFTAGDNSDAS